MGPPVGFFVMALIFWGVPLVGVALAVRWGIRVRRALEARPPQGAALPPGRLERLEEELQAMTLRLDSLEEKQDFMVKLLGAPGRPAPPEGPGAPAKEPG